MKNTFLILIFLTFTNITFSQSIEIESSEPLIEAYLSPLGESLGQGLNSGWYNTAKPHKLGGFDLTFNFNFVEIPNSSLFFNPNEISENFSSDDQESPTILGKGNGATIVYDSQNGFTDSFKMPDHTIEMNNIPIPTLNLSVGIFKETELMFRYIPETTFNREFLGQASLSLTGLGFKHNLVQWLPFAKKLPIDLSIQAAYTKLNTSFELNGNNVTQMVELNTTAFNYNLIFSKKFLMFTPYVSVGNNYSLTNFSSNSTFYLGEDLESIELNIPYDIDFESSSLLNYGAGIRVQFAILSLNISQSFGDYKTTSIGAGISFR